MFTRKRDTSFAAFAEEVANPHDALKAWNEAAYRVVDNSHARRMVAFIGTASYGAFLTQMCRYVNLSLIAYGDTTALVTTTLALLPLVAGIGYTAHQTRVGSRGMQASILPRDPNAPDNADSDIHAQHPKVYAKAKRLREKSANQIGVAHYQM